MVDALRHKISNKVWTPEEKLNLVSQVISGKSNKSVALGNGIYEDVLHQWVHNYQIYGYNGLISKRKGRKPQDQDMKKVGTRKPPNPN